MQQQMKSVKPWYREPIAWSLLAGPIVVVFASFATYYIAAKHSDPMVVDDYYKQGLHINQDLARSQAAVKLGLKAEAMFNSDMTAVRVVLQGPAHMPETLTLRLLHPTLAHHDQSIVLKRSSDGLYEASMKPFAAKHWYIHLEDPQGKWMIEGVWYPDRSPSVSLDPKRAALGNDKSTEVVDD